VKGGDLREEAGACGPGVSPLAASDLTFGIAVTELY
jgi:hypothetical protein